MIGQGLHLDRMRDGLLEARITGFDVRDLPRLTRELVLANGLTESFVYWQVTRGTPPAEAGPARPRVAKQTWSPTVVGFATPVPAVRDVSKPEVKRASLRPDTRWTRGHLKSISLLGGVLAAYEADEQGADDAIMVRGNAVSEGTATNVFLAQGGLLITPSLESASMLGGVTRRLILDEDPSIEQRLVTPAELRNADEVMLVGTKTMVASVASLDGAQVGNGTAGPMAQRLLETLRRAIERDVARTDASESGAAAAGRRMHPAGMTHED